jgi:hypothetical protein
LSSDATLALAPGSEFTLAKTTLTPDEVNGGKTATFDLTLTATESGNYEAFILISNTEDLGAEPFTIPVYVEYTKPYIELAEAVEAVSITTVPATIPVKVRGVLNSNASIEIAQYTNFSAILSKKTITPEELASGDVVFDVIFSAFVSGTYTAAIVIENADIETVTIPLSVYYEPLGISNVLSGISVYVSDKSILHVTGAPAGTHVTVLNVSGQPVFTSTIQSANEQYNVNLASGMYLVKVGNKTWKVLR